jgi:hypothetical protein
MKVIHCTNRKKLTSEQWDWLTKGPGILTFLENKLEIVLEKNQPGSAKYGMNSGTQVGFPTLSQYIEDMCQKLFYIDQAQSYEQIWIHIYFQSRDDLLKVKMSLPPALENNEFAK